VLVIFYARVARILLEEQNIIIIENDKIENIGNILKKWNITCYSDLSAT